MEVLRLICNRGWKRRGVSLDYLIDLYSIYLDVLVAIVESRFGVRTSID